MATPAANLLLGLTILIGILSPSATAARPCKTFFISSFSVSFKPSFDPDSNSNPNPNPNHLFFQDNPSRSGFITIFEVSQLQNPLKPTTGEIFIDRPIFQDEGIENRRHRQWEQEQSALPAGLSWYEYDFSSLRDRAKDILSVVVALLFGVGCGALTAATMYLMWSLFSHRYEFCNSYADSEEEYEDDVDATLKKIGYVTIPAADPVASVPATPAKEVV